MGISIYRQDKDLTYNLKKFILDTPDDLEFLTTNCAPGSSAFIIEGSLLYMLNSAGQWVLIPDKGSGTAGVTIVRMYVNAEGHLICELSDGTIIDAGELPTTNIILINGGNANTIYNN